MDTEIADGVFHHGDYFPGAKTGICAASGKFKLSTGTFRLDGREDSQGEPRGLREIDMLPRMGQSLLEQKALTWFLGARFSWRGNKSRCIRSSSARK